MSNSDTNFGVIEWFFVHRFFTISKECFLHKNRLLKKVTRENVGLTKTITGFLSFMPEFLFHRCKIGENLYG